MIIKIHKKNKNRLKDFGDGTFDEVLSQLIDRVEESLPIVDIDYSTVTSMKISEKNRDKLDSYKLSEGESYENVIVRMLILAQSLNTIDE